MVYVRRGELRVAYVWKLLRNTDARVCVCVSVCGASRSVRLCSLLSEALGGPSWKSPVSWEPLGRPVGAFWDVLERLGRPLEC